MVVSEIRMEVPDANPPAGAFAELPFSAMDAVGELV
jgi:hypothetical protein